MATLTINEQIAAFLKMLNEQQKLAVLSVIKTFTDKSESQQADTSFVAEMDERYNSLKNGKVEGHSWEEVKQMARAAVKDAAK